MNKKVNDKIRAVISATRALEKAHDGAGRIAIRNARRSLWARVRAFQEECDVQFKLPEKEISQAKLTWEGKAQRMTALGFDREVIEPEWWLRNLKTDPDLREAPQTIIDRHFQELASIVAKSCAEYGVPVPMIEPDQVGALNLGGSGHLGIKDATFANFLRSLAKWILWQQGELKFRKKRRSGGRNPRSKKASEKDLFTKNGTAEVNVRMVEILKLTGNLIDVQEAA